MSPDALMAERSFGIEMKRKDQYLVSGEVQRTQFRQDILRVAREQGVSVPTALAEFFNREEFTPEEMGRFALNTSAQGNLIEGAVTLMHALGVTEETAGKVGVLENYIGVSVTDPSVWGASWTIDSIMNWPPGTSLASSRSQLAKI